MGKKKNRELKPETGKAPGEANVFNAVFRLPEKQKYHVFGFLVWLLGMLIILWVFKS